MTKALISIDYSYDFVADDGKLTAGKPAQAIEDRIAQVTQEAYDNGDYIFVAMDRHDEGDTFHPETKLFPPHNIVGTSGRELYGKLAGVYDAIKDDNRVFWMDKRHYSAFSGTDTDLVSQFLAPLSVKFISGLRDFVSDGVHDHRRMIVIL